MNDRPQPQNAQLEASILASCFFNPNIADLVSEKCLDRDFYTTQHRAIFCAIKAFRDKNQAINAELLANWLNSRREYEGLGLTVAIDELYANISSFTEHSLGGAIDALKEKAIQRDLIEVGHKILALAIETENPKDGLAQAEQMIFNIGKERGEEDFKPIFDTVYLTLEKIKNIQKKISGVPTGIWGLDKITGGFQKRDMIFLAGRPSSGKSALMQSIAVSAAIAEYPVGIISIESPIDTLNQRFMAATSGVNLLRLKNKWMDAAEWQAVEETIGPLANLPIYQKHARRISTSQIKSIARRMKNSVGIELLAIDYAQLIKAAFVKNMTKADALEEVSGEIKDLADELDIPVLLLGQIKRKDPLLMGKSKQQNFRPRLDELKGTGCLSGKTLIRCHKHYKKMNIIDNDNEFMVYSHINKKGSIPMKAKSCFSTGEKQTFIITLSTGHSIRATLNHQFFMVGEQWKKLEDILVGDLIGLSIKESDSKKTTMTDDDLKFIGLFIGNGCALPRRSIQYTSNSLDGDLCEEMLILSNKICNKNLRPFIKQEIFRRGTKKESSAKVVYFPSARVPARGYHNPIIAYLENHGLFGKRAKEKTMPEEIFNQPAKSRKLFLKYLWAADGTINYSEGIKKRVNISYSTSSKILAIQVQLLLQSVGILASVIEVRKGKFICYCVSIYSRLFKKKFMDEIGIAGERKGTILEECKNKNNKVDAGWTKYELSEDKTVCYVPVKSIIPYGIETVYDIEVPESHNFIANGFIVHNSWEQDSDVVLLLHREHFYHPEDSTLIGQAELDIAKQRQGPRGHLDISFDEKTTRFYQVEPTQAEAEGW